MKLYRLEQVTTTLPPKKSLVGSKGMAVSLANAAISLGHVCSVVGPVGCIGNCRWGYFSSASF